MKELRKLNATENMRIVGYLKELHEKAPSVMDLAEVMATYFEDGKEAFHEVYRGVHDVYNGDDASYSQHFAERLKNKSLSERFKVLIATAEGLAGVYFTDAAERAAFDEEISAYNVKLSALESKQYLEALAEMDVKQLAERVDEMIDVCAERVASDPGIALLLDQVTSEDGSMAVSEGSDGAVYLALAHYIAERRGELPDLLGEPEEGEAVDEKLRPYYLGVAVASAERANEARVQYARGLFDAQTLFAKVKDIAVKAFALMLTAAADIITVVGAAIVFYYVRGFAGFILALGILCCGDDVRQFLDDVVEGVYELAKLAVKGVTFLVGKAKELYEVIKEKAPEFWEKAVDVAMNIKEKLVGIWEKIKAGVVSFIEGCKEKFAQIRAEHSEAAGENEDEGEDVGPVGPDPVTVS